LRKEIYLYRYDEKSWNMIVDDIEKYTEKDNEYVYDDGDKKICLIKKRYKSPSHVILQHEYTKRIGWENGSFYVSSMFLLEFQRHKALITQKFHDPILNIPYDPLDVYCTSDRSSKHPAKIIECVDLDEIVKISEKNLAKLYDSKTVIEICIDKYMKEDHPFLVENLEKMIAYLAKYKYVRPPYLYATFVKLKTKNIGLYELLREGNEIVRLGSLDAINDWIIEGFIGEDDADKFFEFIGIIKKDINKGMIDKIIRYKSEAIIEKILDGTSNEYLTYYLALMSGRPSKLVKFDPEIAVNFLKEILLNGVYDSFVYLIEHYESVITTIFDDCMNLLHIAKDNSIIDKIMESQPDLAGQLNSVGDTPAIHHSKYNPSILEILMKYPSIDFTTLDSRGNSCLHHLCKHNEPVLLKKFLKHSPELINMPNLEAEYPVIIACKNRQEEMFYILKAHHADLSAKDNYGNTAFHYICGNSICLGISVPEIQNYFGLTPIDYCKLSPKYYDCVAA